MGGEEHIAFVAFPSPHPYESITSIDHGVCNVKDSRPCAYRQLELAQLNVAPPPNLCSGEDDDDKPIPMHQEIRELFELSNWMAAKAREK